MKQYKILSGFLVVLVILFSISFETVSAQTSTTGSNTASIACFSPAINIRYGADDASVQGGVTSLQQFLVSHGYFNNASLGTGHFGPLTLKAIMAFQSANNLPSTGFVGPLTRAVISQQCGLVQTNTNLSATPISGYAPLSVSFSGTGLKGGSQYIIDYGDGANSGPLSAINVCMGTINNSAGCPKVGSSHTYSSNGTYTATLQDYIGCMWSNPRCMIATIPIGKVTITVGSSGQQALSINALDAPSTLALGQAGSWTVHVLANNNSGTLHYSVIWGDEQNTGSFIMAPQSSTITTSSMFTHTYQHSGTYTPAFTVTDETGASVSASNTITISPLY
jgi:hypothetical protein